jgi:glycosyltransferase involved in cell wall biosynthesis
MAPLRLALATPRFWPLIGDGPRHVLRLAESLIGLGHSVTIVTPQWKRTWPPQMWIGQVPVVRLRGNARGGWGTLRWMYGLAGWLKEQRWDGVVVLGLKHEAYVALGAARKSGTPTILIAGEDDLGWQQTATLGRRVAKRCHEARAVVAPTVELANSLKERGFAGECITVISRSTAIPPPRTPKLREDARFALAAANYDLVTTANAQVAVAVGRLDTAQRFGDLVRAWRIVAARHSEARLWLVGDGPERETLYRQVSDLDQRFRVLLPGTFDCLDELFQASDMLLAPAAITVPPLALIEAQAAGLPVVAADSSALDAHVVHERTGLLYAAGDFKALAGAVNRLIEQPGMAVSYGAAGRAAAEQWPRPEEEAGAYVDLIQQLQ